MVAILDVALVVASLPVAICAGYLLLLTVFSRRPAVSAPVAPRLRFDVVVPAHDEEAGIGRTVRNLLALDYPRELFRVLVVADNCRDATADRAREAGAHVLVRRDPERRGKGFALEHAIAASAGDGVADAVVIVDADTTATPNLLRAFAARLEAGAVAVQSRDLVGNPEASWRTRLMAVAFSTMGTLRALGRERLGCSVPLRGNGMCFSTALLRAVPYRAFSIVEDAEYAIQVVEAGHRVALADDAAVLATMLAGAKGAAAQRRRWEAGRLGLARRHAARLLRAGLARRSRILLDAGMEALIPPLTLLGAAALVGTALAFGASALVGRGLVARWAWGATLPMLVAYVARGWVLSGTGWKGLWGLAWCPVYGAWKLGLRLSVGWRRASPQEWVRTRREAEPGIGPGTSV